MSDLDVIKAALEAAGITRVYKFGAVPATFPDMYPYAVVSTAPNAPQVRTLDGSGDPMGRFVVQHFGKTADSLDDLTGITFDAFDGQVLPLPGSPVAWQEIASPAFRDPDNQGVLTITHTYRF